MPTSIKTLGDWIQVKRHQKGLTPCHLAAKMGIASTLVHSWENGTCEPDERQRQILSNLLAFDAVVDLPNRASNWDRLKLIRDEIVHEDNLMSIRQIREDFITGSSCTVVLWGAETPQRKFVDWEIKATLDKEHGLIGINLLTNPRLLNGNVTVPNRLFDNIQSGYAIWTNWQAVAQNPALLTNLVEQANARSKALIRNQRELRTRSG